MSARSKPIKHSANAMIDFAQYIAWRVQVKRNALSGDLIYKDENAATSALPGSTEKQYIFMSGCWP